MNSIKKNITFITGFVMIILSVVNLIIYKSDYLYRPKNYILFGAVYIISSAIIIFFSIKYKKEASKSSKIVALFLPIIALIYLVTLVFCFDLSINHKTYNILYYEMLFAVTIISSLMIFFTCSNIKWLKIIVGVLSFLGGALLCFVLLISLFFTTFTESTVLQTIVSPDDTYIAAYIHYDSGALGTESCVRVRKSKPKITFLIGSIVQEEEILWMGEWGDDPSPEWKDNDTLTINGVDYDLN